MLAIHARIPFQQLGINLFLIDNISPNEKIVFRYSKFELNPSYLIANFFNSFWIFFIRFTTFHLLSISKKLIFIANMVPLKKLQVYLR